MSIVDEQVTPAQVRVRDWLLDYIAGQKLGPGDRVPSERDLATSLGLSRPTVARAITHLVENGVLSRGTGRSGTHVGSSNARRRAVHMRTVGMIMPQIRQIGSGSVDADKTASRYTDHFLRENVSAEIMHGVLSVMKEAGCRLVVHHNNDFEEEAEVIANLVNEHLDGAVIMPERFVDDPSTYASLKNAGPPVVFVDRYLPDAGVDSVVTDNISGARDAVAWLIAKGHRRIAFLTDFGDVTSIMDRETGYRAALEEAGIPCDESLICGPNNMRDRRWSFEHALYYCTNRPDRATAVFGINDDVVWATLQAAQKLGLSVPEDLEVAGFFDAPVPMGIQTSFLRVVQAKFRIGQIAGRLLLERINGEGPAEPRRILVPADLMPGSDEEGQPF